MKYALCILILITSACATVSSKDRPKATTPAELAFYKAEDALDSGEFQQAVLRFNRVKRRFPYSKYSALSDLRIGDAYFEQAEYPSAVEQYRGFRKLHPNHPKVPYASWRIADSYYQNIPSDFFVYPPVHERELSRSKDAEREFRRFLKKYKDSEWAGDAEQRLIRVRRVLADHEFYVAEFYLDKGNPRAAALRLSYLLKNYSGLGLDPNALYLLGRSYLELKDVEKATLALSDLINAFPNHALANDAREYLRTHQLAVPKVAPESK